MLHNQMKARPQDNRLARDHRNPTEDTDSNGAKDATVDMEVSQEVTEGMDHDSDGGDKKRPKVPALVSAEVDEDECDEFDGIVEGNGHEDADDDGDSFV